MASANTSKPIVCFQYFLPTNPFDKKKPTWPPHPSTFQRGLHHLSHREDPHKYPTQTILSGMYGSFSLTQQKQNKPSLPTPLPTFLLHYATSFERQQPAPRENRNFLKVHILKRAGNGLTQQHGEPIKPSRAWPKQHICTTFSPFVFYRLRGIHDHPSLSPHHMYAKPLANVPEPLLSTDHLPKDQLSQS